MKTFQNGAWHIDSLKIINHNEETKIKAVTKIK